MHSYWGIHCGLEEGDLVNEGLLAVANGARRFVWFCSRCGESHLELADLREHAREVHRVRGEVEAVKLGDFCRESARLAMRRTCRRGLLLEEPREEVDLGVDSEAEERLLLEAALRIADARIRGGVVDLLLRAARGCGDSDPLDLLEVALSAYPHLVIGGREVCK